ncbi:MAG: phosphopantetheine-binding protein [Dysgonamonadaceae bacterium]|jgi:acyl carrier protein|nr:phosphopantetheine-binding protein [Dysgonamonadaceae bacterium]
MNEFMEQMADIFEVDAVDLNDNLEDFDAWDSLTQLTIISLADENYGVTISAKELRDAKTIGGLKKLLLPLIP